MREFDIIYRHFARSEDHPRWVKKGIGDDGALLTVSPGQELVVVTDTSVSGVHFKRNQPPDSLGYRSLAVNLSDIAAMGAIPKWATLNLTLEAADAKWIEQFAMGFFRLADESGCPLVGGDTTAGPLSVTVTVGGEVAEGQALLRSGARPGDLIFVSGRLGGAAAALALAERKSSESLQLAFDYPKPQIALGIALSQLASSAIDLSDGLMADLGHILHASGDLGATIDIGKIPLYAEAIALLGYPRAMTLALSGGDDYELCFTAPPTKHDAVSKLQEPLGVEIHCVGQVTPAGGCRLIGDATGLGDLKGFEHRWESV